MVILGDDILPVLEIRAPEGNYDTDLSSFMTPIPFAVGESLAYMKSSDLKGTPGSVS
ncbi:MAG: hypothetical protein GKR87_05080 [Kiritimatiellae bacterium]|nr:hypothetical protein [Kiritimatiellia bacterium]